MDRQDIDALLIGALYGELTPADEARLTAHLDSHPTDRGALDDLKSARQAVRESRIFDLQLDPPQSVSALLLQEAHRRAPKRVVVSEEKESWFYRFTRVFLAHPAMAAAAMLVLVVGVAGTLYMRKGEQFRDIAQPSLEATTTSEQAAMAPTTATQPPADPTAADQGAGEGVVAGSGYSVGLEDKAMADDGAKLDSNGNRRELAKRQDQKNKKNSIVVETPQRQPKELEESRAKSPAKKGAAPDNFGDADRGFNDITISGTTTTTPGASTGAAGGAPSGRVATTPSASGPARNAPSPPPPPPSAAPAPATVAQGTTKPTTPPAAKPTVTKEAEKAEAAPAKDAPAKDTALIAWAKGQHSQAVSLANNGKCVDAAKVAVGIQNRAPDYYSQFMATDRALKKCQSYIAAERDAEAERSGKARAQKRVNADEPAATTK